MLLAGPSQPCLRSGGEETHRDRERHEWQLLIPRAGHKGTSFRSHSGWGGGLKSLPESCRGESMEGPVLMGETPRQASPHAWMSELCVSGRFRVTLSSRQIWLGFGKG